MRESKGPKLIMVAALAIAVVISLVIKIMAFPYLPPSLQRAEGFLFFLVLIGTGILTEIILIKIFIRR